MLRKDLTWRVESVTFLCYALIRDSEQRQEGLEMELLIRLTFKKNLAKAIS